MLMLTLLANAGIPMLFWQLPLAILAFVPIAALETLIAWPILKQRFPDVLRQVFAANAVSTFAGVPLAWFGMMVINIATTGGGYEGFDTPVKAFKSIVLQSAWLIPADGMYHWLIPAATLVLLVPYFVVSLVTEQWWLRRKFGNDATRRIALATWLGNLLTYGALFGYTALLLQQGLRDVSTR